MAGYIERVSVDSTGNEANGGSGGSSISADGRLVAFESAASSLVPGDTNEAGDVFVVDRTLLPEQPPPFAIVEKQPVDPGFYGVLAGGPAVGFNDGDFFRINAAVTFESETARFQNVLGYYRITDNMLDIDDTVLIGQPRILFPRIEQAEADPAFPGERPGGGPLAAGETVVLPDTPDFSRYGLFLIANGAALNDPRLFDPEEGTLAFEDADGGIVTPGSVTPLLVFTDADTGERTVVKGDVFHVAGGSASVANPLNPDGAVQVLAVEEPGGPPPGSIGPRAFTLYLEDKRLADPSGDRDFNDLVIRVQESFSDLPPGGSTILAAAPGPEAHRIEPGAGRTRLAGFVEGRDVLELDGFGLGFEALDTSGDGAVGRGDAFVRAKEHRLRIDLGAASGEAPGIDVLIVKGTAILGPEAFG